MAGTSAVFVISTLGKASPVERDGMEWDAKELHLEQLSKGERKSAIASVLALEGLEEYDPATNGDIREVTALGLDFIYSGTIQGWIQMPSTPQQQTEPV